MPDSGTGPGVLVLHAWWGLNDFFKDLCNRLAGEGFVALAPDLYHGKVAATIPEAKKLRGKASSAQIRTDILSAVDQLVKLPEVNSKSIGVIGFSLGAYWALWLSLERSEFVQAVTLFYGTHNADYATSQAAYLGHYAEKDEWQPSSGVIKLEKSLRLANRPVTFHTYPGTGHWFFEKDRVDVYQPEAAKLAWDRTMVFLKTHSGG